MTWDYMKLMIQIKYIIQPDTLVYCANKLNNIDSAWFALPAIASKNINYTWQPKILLEAEVG